MRFYHRRCGRDRDPSTQAGEAVKIHAIQVRAKNSIRNMVTTNGSPPTTGILALRRRLVVVSLLHEVYAGDGPRTRAELVDNLALGVDFEQPAAGVVGDQEVAARELREP